MKNKKDIQKGGKERIFRKEEHNGYLEWRNRKDIQKRGTGTERMYRKEDIKENIRYTVNRKE